MEKDNRATKWVLLPAGGSQSRSDLMGRITTESTALISSVLTPQVGPMSITGYCSTG